MHANLLRSELPTTARLTGGDFKVWLKYQSQDMSGTLTLSDGNTEKWDVKDVGFVNYFSKAGCAIHRIATQSAFNDSSIPGYGEEHVPWLRRRRLGSG